jgi:two-component system OmpR family sensor kinase
VKDYEKRSLIKFTFIYFFSTAFFVILLGYLYYTQQKTQILQKYTMKMHEYAVALKQTRFNHIQNGYSYTINDNKKQFKYQLAIKHNNYYKKSFPLQKNKLSVIIKLDASIIDKELNNLQTFTLLIQITLICVFLLISYLLAKYSLRPMNETISHLDRFVKDLIHDLNTPSTSILLNIKMLKKDIKDNKYTRKLERIQNSAIAISSLYENLEILLYKDLIKKKINLFTLIEEKKENCSILYPNIKFNLDKKEMVVNTNEKAINRIIDNILSNACKYSQENNPHINIKFNNNILSIIDNGKGMQYPKKIFERSYSENENGHGIGMHIVHRLCNDLFIDISISSKENYGTTIELEF